MVAGSRAASIESLTPIDEIKGNLGLTEIDHGLLHSVLENDLDSIEEGRLIADAINQGISSFSPALLMESLVTNYSLAEKLYGPSLIRRLFGYDTDTIQRNIRLPEFQKMLAEQLKKKLDSLKQGKLLGQEQELTERGMQLASLVMYIEELDHIIPKGMLGERLHKERSLYGMKEDIKQYKHERYRDIALRQSLKKALRRSHAELTHHDLMSYERQSNGQCTIVYALDASGSMRGKKIEQCKKAGIALAYKATDARDKVGLIVFGKEVRSCVPVTDDFTRLLKEITRVRASDETDIAATIEASIPLFPDEKVTKHLIIITDALPTVGSNPEQKTLEAISKAREAGITVSVIGIDLSEKGSELAQKMAEIGRGRLYCVRDLEEIDKIVLEDYIITAEGYG